MKLHATAVWDLPTRLFHWALVGLIVFSYVSASMGGLMLRYHLWSGYCVLTLVLFRLMWGVVGGEYARFAQFVRGPRAVLAALPSLLNKRALTGGGHNPLGGWMVLALLVVLLVQAGTGMFANDDIFTEGPLYAHVSKDLSDQLSAYHGFNFVLLLGLVSVHILAIGWHRWRKGEALTSAMVTGRKYLPLASPPARVASRWRALLVLGFAAGLVVGIVNW